MHTTTFLTTSALTTLSLTTAQNIPPVPADLQKAESSLASLVAAAPNSAEIAPQISSFINGASAATDLPAYITALPTSLQGVASSALVPAVSSAAGGAMSSGMVASGTAAGTSGMPGSSANGTNGAGPTAPAAPPAPSPSGNGAVREGGSGVVAAAGVLGLGVAGVMALL